MLVTGSGTFVSSLTAASVIADGTSSEGIIRIERDTVSTNTAIGSLIFTNNNAATTYGKVFGGRNSAGDGYVALGTGVSNNLYALESGNVGIGTSSPSTILDVRGASIYMNISDTSDSRYINFGNWVAGRSTMEVGNGDLFIKTQSSNSVAFGTANTERLRITSGGYTQITSTNSYASTSATAHAIVSNRNGDNVLYLIHSGNSTPYGPYIWFTNVAPNNTTNYFIVCSDSSADRFVFRSNGGLANYQANNVNLSDARTKKDIIPLESYWDKFKAIEIVKFKYKDQTHDDFNIGVIAQQVEEVAPEFVDIDGWSKPKLDDDGNEIISNEEPLKAVYTADLHHATIKVLQEAMTRIEQLEARVQELENK
jgi:hypothetical protein